MKPEEEHEVLLRLSTVGRGKGWVRCPVTATRVVTCEYRQECVCSSALEAVLLSLDFASVKDPCTCVYWQCYSVSCCLQLMCGVVCSVVWCGVVWCVVWCGVVLCGV